MASKRKNCSHIHVYWRGWGKRYPFSMLDDETNPKMRRGTARDALITHMEMPLGQYDVGWWNQPKNEEGHRWAWCSYEWHGDAIWSIRYESWVLGHMESNPNIFIKFIYLLIYLFKINKIKLKIILFPSSRRMWVPDLIPDFSKILDVLGGAIGTGEPLDPTKITRVGPREGLLNWIGSSLGVVVLPHAFFTHPPLSTLGALNTQKLR